MGWAMWGCSNDRQTGAGSQTAGPPVPPGSTELTIHAITPPSVSSPTQQSQDDHCINHRAQHEPGLLLDPPGDRPRLHAQREVHLARGLQESLRDRS